MLNNGARLQTVEYLFHVEIQVLEYHDDPLDIVFHHRTDYESEFSLRFKNSDAVDYRRAVVRLQKISVHSKLHFRLPFSGIFCNHGKMMNEALY